MKNVFLVTGSLPMILAAELAESRFPSDTNILVNERVIRKGLTGRCRPPDEYYWQLTRILERLYPWDRVHNATVVREFASLRQQPLSYFREWRALMTVGAEIRRIISGSIDRVIFSGNTCLYSALCRGAERGGSPEIIKTEHGLGDYSLAAESGNGTLQARLRGLVEGVVLGRQYCPPHRLILTDGGNCQSLTRTKAGRTLIERSPPPDLERVFGKLRKLLADDLPQTERDLRRLDDCAARARQVFLYLPTEDMPLDLYDAFLDAQIRDLDLTDSLFIIKRHPQDPFNYEAMFRRKGLRVVEAEDPIARNLPAEYFLYRLPQARALGAGSSALFLSRWWFGRAPLWRDGGKGFEIPLFAVVKQYFGADIALLQG